MNEFKYCKIEVFIPVEFKEKLFNILAGLDVGHIGKYDCCLSYSEVKGRWRTLDGCNPYKGELNKISEEKELKVEAVCLANKVDEVVQKIKKQHPYEEPVINVIPLYRTSF